MARSSPGRWKGEGGGGGLTTLVLIEVVPVVLMANLKARITAKHKPTLVIFFSAV